MTTNNLYVNITVEKEELKLLKLEKVKLEELAKKIEKTKNEYIGANLSGKINDACVKNNELFYQTIIKRINTMTSLISKFEYACNSYESESNYTSLLVSGKGGNV